MNEVELKFKLTDEQFESLCKRFNIDSSDFYSITDIYFKTTGGISLRIRENYGGSVLTYKSKKVILEDGSASRKEIEPRVIKDDIDEWTEILGELGFPIKVILTKERADIEFDNGVKASIDVLDNATSSKFIELEILTEDPNTAAYKLSEAKALIGLQQAPETRSYIEIYESEMLNKLDIMFESENG